MINRANREAKAKKMIADWQASLIYIPFVPEDVQSTLSDALTDIFLDTAIQLDAMYIVVRTTKPLTCLLDYLVFPDDCEMPRLPIQVDKVCFEEVVYFTTNSWDLNNRYFSRLKANTNIEGFDFFNNSIDEWNNNVYKPKSFPLKEEDTKYKDFNSVYKGKEK